MTRARRWRGTRNWPRSRACAFTSPTRMPPGSAGPTRTPTAWCASTCPRVPTCRCSRRPSSTRSPPGSTVGRARRSASRPPTRCSPGWWTRPPTLSHHEMRRVFATEFESAYYLDRNETMRRPDTKELILDTAERLFAERSYSSVSLREITAEAKVNLAAVNYHFGSKDALLLAVFKRRAVDLNRERLNLLREAESRAGGGPASLRD